MDKLEILKDKIQRRYARYIVYIDNAKSHDVREAAAMAWALKKVLDDIEDLANE